MGATVRFMLKIQKPGLTRGALFTASLAACLACSAWAADAPEAPAKDAAPAAAKKSASNPATEPKRSKPGAGTASSASTKAAATTKDAKAHPSPSRYHPDRFAGRAGTYYELNWGIDSISVKLAESGELVRFSYRVLDPDKARVLNDKEKSASLNDPQAGVSLVVPTMEKIGQLRQSTAPEAGRSYWTAFSNKGRRVARGDRVDVVIGSFKANNLVVD